MKKKESAMFDFDRMMVEVIQETLREELVNFGQWIIDNKKESAEESVDKWLEERKAKYRNEERNDLFGKFL
jgi:hypothetical protein